MKKIILFLLLLYNVAAVAQKSDATMITTATGIKNATAAGSLTPTIIGNMFLDIVKNKSNKIYAGNATGTNDYVLNVSDGVTSYVYGQWFLIGFGNSSTGAVTFNYNGVGALAVKNDAGTQLNTGDLTSGVVKLIVYNGSYFQVVGGSGSGGGGGPTSGSGITVVGTAVNFGGTQTLDAIINGDGGTYGTTFDEQGHFIVNVQGGSDFSVSVADAGDINLSPNSGNINLTTFGSNLTQIIASGSGFAFSVSGAGIQLNVNSDGTGDTHYRNSSGYLARRAIGSTGDVYTVSGGLPTWTTPSVSVSGITGLGTGVATALGINIGSAGSFITNGGSLGTPSSGVATNLTGTASGLTAGTVTTNANLGGDIVSSGNTTTYSGVVPINKGGSGQITANAALNAFLPSQASANGKVLQSDGTNSSWQTPSSSFTNPMTSIGDLIQGSTAGTAVRLASAATGNALISGGLTTLSSWGKITSGHIDGTIQPTASPTFTGTVTFPSPWTLGSTSVTSTGTELNYVAGVTSAIQTQLNGKQATITFGTGVQTALGVNVGSAGAPVLFNGAGGTPSSIGLANGTGLPESGVTNLVSDLALKAPLASPTFTGTVVIPSPFTLGAASVTSTGTQLNYLNATTGTTGTTSTNLVYSASPTFTGAPLVPTASVGTNTTQIANTAFVAQNASPLYPAANRQTASYTFALTDVGKTVEMNVASANTLTIPPNSSVAFPTNTQLVASQYGAGVTTLTAGAGVTFRNASGALAFSAQYTFIYAYKIGTDEWYIVNSTTPFINPMTTLGDIIYTDATPTATRLAGNTSATGKVLKQTGTGSISAAPVWAILGGNDILGTTTNDNATTGYIQENFRSIVSTYTNYTTTATYQNIASITLTAGDYEVDAGFTFSSNGATITAASDAIFVISTTTASASGALEAESISYIPQAALLGTSHESGHIVPYRVSLSGTTTYYLNTQASFTIGNPQFVGMIHARRVR